LKGEDKKEAADKNQKLKIKLIIAIAFPSVFLRHHSPSPASTMLSLSLSLFPPPSLTSPQQRRRAEEGGKRWGEAEGSRGSWGRREGEGRGKPLLLSPPPSSPPSLSSASPSSPASLGFSGRMAGLCSSFPIISNQCDLTIDVIIVPIPI
jgi:hypothetical protein